MTIDDHVRERELDWRVQRLAPRCQAAIDQGACTRTPCESKAAALALIRDGQADLMTVQQPAFWIEAPTLLHFAIRFDDRELGDAARALSIEGFLGNGSVADLEHTASLEKAIRDAAKLIEQTLPENHVGLHSWLKRPIVRAVYGPSKG